MLPVTERNGVALYSSYDAPLQTMNRRGIIQFRNISVLENSTLLFGHDRHIYTVYYQWGNRNHRKRRDLD